MSSWKQQEASSTAKSWWGQKQVGESDVVLPLKKVIRIAGDNDAKIVDENKAAARNAFATCLEED